MSNPFAPAPEPTTELGRYRLLSPLCGLRVSPLCLGAMSLGKGAWDGVLGAITTEDSYKLLDAYHDAGGNFIDTANNYQNEESEELIGEWMAKRQNRDQMVIATKYTTGYKTADQLGAGGIRVNYQGNSLKSMHVSVNASLKKMQTDYIDILYLHWWDYTTPIEEIMQGLNNLVKAGKVLYLGISDTPAWIVADCNRYAKDHGLAQFVVYQGRWSAESRDFEREIIPMCRSLGLGIASWGSAGGGKFKTAAAIEALAASGGSLRPMFGGTQTPSELAISAALEKVGKEIGTTTITAVALAYVMQKTPYVFPIIGGRKVEHLMANIEALSLRLSVEQIAYLESIVPFDVGFPSTFIGQDPHLNGGETNFLLNSVSKYSFVPGTQAIKPAGGKL